MCAMTGMWWSEVEVRGQLEVVCSFNVLFGSRDKIQAIGLRGKSLYPLSHPRGPGRKFLSCLAFSFVFN